MTGRSMRCSLATWKQSAEDVRRETTKKSDSSMSPYGPTVIATYGGWELVEGFSGRVLRRRRHRGAVKPHTVLGALTMAAGVWAYWTAQLLDGPAALVVGFGAFIVFLGARFRGRDARDLRLGATELDWVEPGEVTGTRWPHSELSHISIVLRLRNVARSTKRRRLQRPYFQVMIVKKDGAVLPVGFLLSDVSTAEGLAGLLADTTGLDVRTESEKLG